MEFNEGERLHKQRRTRFWVIIIGLYVLAIVSTLFGTMIYINVQDGKFAPWTLDLAAVGVIGLTLLFALATLRFYLDVDELELTDNLWGALIGFSVYFLLFPAWWALHKFRHAPEPDDWTIYFVVTLAGFAAYAYRKWRLR